MRYIQNQYEVERLEGEMMSVYQNDSAAETNREIAVLSQRVKFLERQTFVLTRVLIVVGGAFVGALPSVVIALVK